MVKKLDHRELKGSGKVSQRMEESKQGPEGCIFERQSSKGKRACAKKRVYFSRLINKPIGLKWNVYRDYNKSTKKK